MSKDDEGYVLITVYTHSTYGREIQIRLSKDIFLDEQPEAIGRVVIDAWKSLAHPKPTKEQKT